MNTIEKLIAELCPEGVEFKELSKLASVETGTQLNKTEMAEIGDYPVLNGGINPSGFYHECNTDENKIAISQGGASAGYVNFVTRKFWAGAHCFVVKPISNEINNKYLYFLLKNGQEKLQNAKLGAGIPGLNKKELQDFPIPIPPLSIQQEIVKILDTFTTLEAELEAELEARKKQYEYYRDELLTFGEDVEWKTLGEVTSLITKGTTPNSYKQSGISFIKTEAFDGTRIDKSKLSYIDEITHQTFLKRSMLETNDILFTIAGATIGKGAIVTEDILPANTNQALAIIRLSQNINTKYIFYILKSNYMREYINQSVKGSAQPNLNLQQLNDFPIPIPPIAEQKRIVTILDKFDALVNDISVGLPAELNARRKQYEYYRGKLLTFKPLGKDHAN